MRCDYCPLGSDEDVCPEAENESELFKSCIVEASKANTINKIK